MLAKIRELRSRYQRQISLFIAITLVIVWIVELTPANLLPFEAATAYSFGLILIILVIVLDVLEKRLDVTEKALDVLEKRLDVVEKGLIVFENQTVANPTLLAYIETYKVKKARIIQYGATFIREPVIQLLNKGAEVDLLLQNPDTCISKFQKDNILNFIDVVMQGLGESADTSRLHIYFYSDQASYRAINLDDNLLLMSWYTYESADQSKKQSEKQIWGHIHPQIMIRSDSKYYEPCRNMFYFVLDRLMIGSLSIEDYLRNHQN